MGSTPHHDHLLTSRELTSRILTGAGSNGHKILALRISTGCLKMADVAELHQEARELPVSQHNELISQQFDMACHLPQHLSHQLCHRPPDDRPEPRRCQIGWLMPNIQQYLAEEPLSNTSYKSATSSIHQDVVKAVIESSSSKQLNGRPPPIASAEQTAKEDMNYTGTTAHSAQPNPWSAHE